MANEPTARVPRVSVILPTYNRAQYLPQAVNSVLRQSFDDLELIVVDDASDDDTKSIIERISDRRLRYIRHERNRGGSAARNTGIAAAHGMYVAFQDSDDIWLSDKLARQMAVAGEGKPTPEVIYCAYTKQTAGATHYVPDPRLPRRDGEILPQLLAGNFVGTPTLVVRRSLLQEIGGFDESLGRFQDWELVIRLAGVARFHLVDEPLVNAGHTPDSVSENASAGAAAIRTMLERHGALYRQHPDALFRALTSVGHLECQSGDLSGARRHFRQALRIHPFSGRVFVALMLSYLGRHAYLSAISALRSARRVWQPASRQVAARGRS